MFLATKILLAIAFMILFWAIINFVSKMGERRREAKEIRELQKQKEEESIIE